MGRLLEDIALPLRNQQWTGSGWSVECVLVTEHPRTGDGLDKAAEDQGGNDLG